MVISVPVENWNFENMDDLAFLQKSNLIFLFLCNIRCQNQYWKIAIETHRKMWRSFYFLLFRVILGSFRLHKKAYQKWCLKKMTFSSSRIYEIPKVVDMEKIYVHKIISIYQNKIPMKLKEHKHRTSGKRKNSERKKGRKRIDQQCWLQKFIHRKSESWQI